jgi:hypothetical protein
VYTNERWNYIVDGDDFDENNCTQSDFVRVALNIAYVSPEKLQQEVLPKLFPKKWRDEGSVVSQEGAETYNLDEYGY